MKLDSYVLRGIVFIHFVLSGCALKQRMDVDLPKTFLEDVDLKSKKDNLPFGHVWIKPGDNKTEYVNVHIKPVRTDLIGEESWQHSKSAFVSSKEEFDEKAKEISAYFDEQLKEKLNNYKNPRLPLTDTPGDHTLLVEIALTELELSHPVARAGALVAPIPGTGPVVASISDPHMAFAARLYKGNSGELIATAADRKFAPLRLIDFNKLAISSTNREIASIWAETITEALQSDGLTKVSEKSFSLLPW